MEDGLLSGSTLRQEISSARQRKHADVHDGDMQMQAIMQKSRMRHNMLRRLLADMKINRYRVVRELHSRALNIP